VLNGGDRRLREAGTVLVLCVAECGCGEGYPSAERLIARKNVQQAGGARVELEVKRSAVGDAVRVGLMLPAI